MKTTSSKYLKYSLLCFLLLLFLQENILGQRRGVKNKDREAPLELMKDICCNFVNDNRLTKEAKAVVRKDAFALARKVLIKELEEKQVNENMVEELASLVYSALVYIRLYGGEETKEMNLLGIRENGKYEDYQTAIQLDIANLNDYWIFEYSITFKEGEEGVTKNWKIFMTYCEWTYKLETNSTVVPTVIQEKAMERVLEEKN